MFLPTLSATFDGLFELNCFDVVFPTEANYNVVSVFGQMRYFSRQHNVTFWNSLCVRSIYAVLKCCLGRQITLKRAEKNLFSLLILLSECHYQSGYYLSNAADDFGNEFSHSSCSKDNNYLNDLTGLITGSNCAEEECLSTSWLKK